MGSGRRGAQPSRRACSDRGRRPHLARIRGAVRPPRKQIQWRGCLCQPNCGGNSRAAATSSARFQGCHGQALLVRAGGIAVCSWNHGQTRLSVPPICSGGAEEKRETRSVSPAFISPHSRPLSPKRRGERRNCHGTNSSGVGVSPAFAPLRPARLCVFASLRLARLRAFASRLPLRLCAFA